MAEPLSSTYSDTAQMAERLGLEPFLLPPNQACCHYTRRSMLPRRFYKYPTLERKASEAAGLTRLPLTRVALLGDQLQAATPAFFSGLVLPRSVPQGWRVLQTKPRTLNLPEVAVSLKGRYPRDRVGENRSPHFFANYRTVLRGLWSVFLAPAMGKVACRPDSNRRPRLPHFKAVLYQLSYSGVGGAAARCPPPLDEGEGGGGGPLHGSTVA